MAREQLFQILSFVAVHAGVLDAYDLARRCSAKPYVVVLMYHRVAPSENFPFSLAPVKPDNFEEQVRYLCSTFELLSLEEIAFRLCNGKGLPRKGAAITLDDGYRDNYEYAYPILHKNRAPATIFLATGRIGTGKLFWWDELRYAIFSTELPQVIVDGLGPFSLGSIKSKRRAVIAVEGRAKKLPDDARESLVREVVQACRVEIPHNLGRQLLLGWDEIREMNAKGVSFGAHGVSHGILTRMTMKRAKLEIVQSKKDIEGVLQRPVSAFCYPNGDYDEHVMNMVRESGFACAVTMKHGMVTSDAKVHELARISPGPTVETLKASISALYSDYRAVSSSLRRLQRAASWTAFLNSSVSVHWHSRHG